MTFTVKYRHHLSPFWRTIKRVEGENLTVGGTSWIFYLEDKSLVSVPTSMYHFKFSKERFELIKKQMEEEAKQPIATR